MTSIHTKTNLTCKCLCFERLVAAAASSFRIPPSQLVVVDLCSSYAKDLFNLEVVGIQPENYFGFDNDVNAPTTAQQHYRTSLNLVTHLDLVKSDDQHIHDCIASAMASRSRHRRAHIVLANFAIHLFAKDLGKIFRLVSSAQWAHPDGALVQCSYISRDGIEGVIRNVTSYGSGVSYNPTSLTLTIEAMAKYVFDPTMKRMTPTILRENMNQGGFANNGVAEHIVSDDEIIEAARGNGFVSICEKDELAHIKLFYASIRRHMSDAKTTEKIVSCLNAFMTIHKTLFFVMHSRVSSSFV